MKNKIPILMVIVVVLTFNLIILFLSIDIQNGLTVSWQIYNTLQVPISIFAGFLIAKYFERKKIRQKINDQVKARKNIANLVDFLYIQVREVLENKESFITSKELEDIKHAQEITLDNLKHSSHILDISEASNIEWAVKGRMFDIFIYAIMNNSKNKIPEKQFRRDRKLMFQLYDRWLVDIKKILSELRTDEWDSGIKLFKSTMLMVKTTLNKGLG